MDIELRELERKASTGDTLAQQQLEAKRRRSGLRTVRKSMGQVITDLMGCQVRYINETRHMMTGHDVPDKHFNKIGRVVGAYVPGGGNYSTFLHLVMETNEGELVHAEVDYFQVIK